MNVVTEKRRVVVTGVGTVTSFGDSVDEFWDSLIAGRSGIRRVQRFDPSIFPCQVAGEITDFDATRWMDPKEARRNDRYTHYAMAAAKMAVADASLDTTAVDGRRFGVIVGSGIGGMETIENQVRTLHERGPRRVSVFMIPSLISNMAGGVIAIEMGARGPNYATVSACSTATHAIGDSLRMIRAGDADIMLAGGSEAAVTPLGFAGFCAMKTMATGFNDEPARASRPFDRDREGFIMGEGAGVVLLETYEHAMARGAPIYAELCGYAATCDAHHITLPDPDGAGLSECFRLALADAGIEASSVDYINAHGTSTPPNDRFETKAIRNVFGDHADNLLVSSTKSMTGHLLGAAGGIEAVVAAKAIKTGIVPPTINQENADPDCDLNYVPNKSVRANIRVAISDNLGFGGHNAALVLRKLDS